MAKLIMTLIMVAGITAGTARADILIGLAGPMTGPVSAFGEQMQNGAVASVEMINASGRIAGERIKLLIEDDACDPKQAVQVANRLVARHVTAVIGHWCSQASMAASAIYENADIVMLDPGSLLGQMTQQGFKNIFRMTTTERGFAQRAAAYIKTLPIKRVAIAADARGITRNLGAALAADIMPVMTTDTFYYNGGEKDYTALVTKIENTRPDAVFISGYDEEAGLIVRGLRQSGYQGEIIGMDTLGSSTFKNITGTTALGVKVIDYARPSQSAALQQLEAALRKLNKPEDTYALMTAAAIDVLVDVLQHSDRSGEKMRSQLLQRNFATPVGQVSFAPNGDRINPAIGLYEWTTKGLVAK